MRFVVPQRVMILVVGCLGGGLVFGGCYQASQTPNAKSESTSLPVNNAPKISANTAEMGVRAHDALKAPQIALSPKGTPPPLPTATMTVTQALGVEILKAINEEPRMTGHKISVGTGPNTVWLDGSVTRAAQRVLAERITKRKAAKAKVVNRLAVKK